MLTELTQATVAVLNDIACREVSSRWTQYTPSPDVLAEVLAKLEATGEQLNCNHEASEEMYLQYGTVARKLGVVNRMTRLYLSEIKLIDL